jgi:hypothetical protein
MAESESSRPFARNYNPKRPEPFFLPSPQVGACEKTLPERNAAEFDNPLGWRSVPPHENKDFDPERPSAALCDRCLIDARIARGDLFGSTSVLRDTFPSSSSRNLEFSSNLNPPRQYETNHYL